MNSGTIFGKVQLGNAGEIEIETNIEIDMGQIKRELGLNLISEASHSPAVVKAMVFPVVMYGCESWTIKKTEHQRIVASKSVVPEKTLASPLDSKEIMPAIPK